MRSFKFSVRERARGIDSGAEYYLVENKVIGLIGDPSKVRTQLSQRSRCGFQAGTPKYRRFFNRLSQTKCIYLTLRRRARYSKSRYISR